MNGDEVVRPLGAIVLAVLTSACSSTPSAIPSASPVHGGTRTLPRPAEIVLVNTDPPGFGLNDSRPFRAVGENHARTLGEARWNGALRAAGIWASHLRSTPKIVLEVSFNREPCGAPGLANGGFQETLVDFSGATPGVHYSPALANAIAGRDLNGDAPEGRVEVLAIFDDEPGCIGHGWYYGFDHPNHFSEYGLDYVSVLLHEMGHALGFGTLMSQETGTGTMTAFDAGIYDETLQEYWPSLTPAERVASAARKHHLTWNGPWTNRAAERYPFATTNGHLRLDAGAHLAHWEGETTGGHVGLLMTGSATNEVRSDFLDVTPCVLGDMGFPLISGPDECSSSQSG